MSLFPCAMQCGTEDKECAEKRKLIYYVLYYDFLNIKLYYDLRVLLTKDKKSSYHS